MKTIPNNVAQRGFSLISAIFLLVVLAGLGAAMLSFSSVQHQTSALDALGSRAYQASRAGIEWGAYQALQASGAAFATACRGGATSSTLAAGTLAGTLSGFGVDVSCVASAHSDVNATTGTVWVYQLTATAKQGALGTPTYIERQVQAGIAQ